MRTALMAALMLAPLAGCANDQAPPPAIQIKTVDRVVETQRPCAVKIPDRPAPLMTPLPTDAVALAAVLGLKLREYAGRGEFADQALSALRTCTKP